MEFNKTLSFSGIAIFLLIALYFIFPIFATDNSSTVELESIDIPILGNVSLVIDGIYWGSYEQPALENVICSNETKDSTLTFIVLVKTGIKASAFESCYIINNGNESLSKTVEKYGNYMAFSSVAETDRPNLVKACCIFDSTELCTEESKLYICK